MPITKSGAISYVESHTGVLGKGWTEVDNFDNLDPDEYELEEDEEEYVTLDLGPEMDPKYLQTEGTYQLIGMDTALPHLKIGNTVLQGEVTPLIGTEIILGLIRNEENPLRPSHPPLYTTSKRISFVPIQLKRIDQSFPQPSQEHGEEGQEGEGEEGRSMFLKQDARYGPNKPEKLPGRKRDRDRAAKRAERLASGMDVEGSEESDEAEGMDVEDTPTLNTLQATTTPGAGPSTSPRSNISPIRQIDHSRINDIPIGRPRTRPLIEITSIPELAHLDITSLPANIRIMVLPHVIHELDPTTPSKDPMHLPKKPFEYTKGQIKKLVNAPSGGGRKIHARRFGHLAPEEDGASLPHSMTMSMPTLTPTPMPTLTPTPARVGAGSVVDSIGSKVVTFKHKNRDEVEVPKFVISGSDPASENMGRRERVGEDKGVRDVLPEMRLDMRDEDDAEARASDQQ